MPKLMNHAALPAFELKRALEFYKTYFHFQDYHCSDKDWAMLRLHDSTLSLVYDPHLDVEKRKLQTGNPSHLGITVDTPQEVDELHRKLQSTEGLVVSSIKEHRDQSYGFYFLDTEGNQLECIFIPVLPVLDKAEDKKVVLFLQNSVNAEILTQYRDSLLNCLQKSWSRYQWVFSSSEFNESELENQLQKLGALPSEILLLPDPWSRPSILNADLQAFALRFEKYFSAKVKIVVSPGLEKRRLWEMGSFLERAVMEAEIHESDMV